MFPSVPKGSSTPHDSNWPTCLCVFLRCVHLLASGYLNWVFLPGPLCGGNVCMWEAQCCLSGPSQLHCVWLHSMHKDLCHPFMFVFLFGYYLKTKCFEGMASLCQASVDSPFSEVSGKRLTAAVCIERPNLSSTAAVKQPQRNWQMHFCQNKYVFE